MVFLFIFLVLFTFIFVLVFFVLVVVFPFLGFFAFLFAFALGFPSAPGRFLAGRNHQLVLIFLLFDLGFVAQGLERRSFIGAQGDDINPRSLGVGEFEVNIAQDFVKVAVREEGQIFSVRIEDRGEAVGHPLVAGRDLTRCQTTELAH